MNKSELIEKIAAETGLSKSAVDRVIAGMFEVVGDHVSSSPEKVIIPGWISFQQTTRSARLGRNPRTGEPIQIPATKGVRISAGSRLKAAAKPPGDDNPPEEFPPIDD